MKRIKHCFLDTNIFLRVWVKGDEKSQKECMAVLEKVKSGEVKGYVSCLVMAELVWTLRSFYGEPRKKVVRLVRGVRRLRGMRLVTDGDVSEALELYDKHGVKYIDACIAIIPQVKNRKWTVVSYDRDFGKLPVRWVQPGEV